MLNKLNAISAVSSFLAQATDGTATENKGKGKKNAPPASHVLAAAKTSGAAQGKDKGGPVTRDFSRSLAEIADAEMSAINKQVELMGTRVEQWIKVGEIAKLHGGDPETVRKEVFNRYANMVKLRIVKVCYDRLGKTALYDGLEADERGVRSNWPADVQTLYDKAYAPRVSETNKVLTAFDKTYTETMKVLTSKGSMQQKLVQLPNVSRAGRKAGTPNENKGGGSGPKVGATGTAEQKQKEITEAAKSQLVNVNPEEIPALLQQLCATGRKSKQFTENPHFKILIEACTQALAKFEVAMNVEASNKTGTND